MCEENDQNDQSPYDPLNAEDLEIALEPYKGNPSAALSLGFNLMVLKRYLTIEPLKIEDAIKGIDIALEVLFPHTEFHLVSFDYFLRVIEGKLTVEQEQTLKALGIKL